MGLYSGSPAQKAEQFAADLAGGKYTSVGSYPVFFVTADGEALSYASAKKNKRRVREAILSNDRSSGWQVVGSDINWEDPNLYCSDSDCRIESAYAEDRAVKENPAEDSDKERAQKMWMGIGLVGLGAVAIYAAYSMMKKDEPEKSAAALPPAPQPSVETFVDPKAPSTFFAPPTGSWDVVQVYDESSASWLGAPEPLPVGNDALAVVNSFDPKNWNAGYQATAKASGCDQLPAFVKNPPGASGPRFVYRWVVKDGVLSKWAEKYSNCTDGKLVSTAGAGTYGGASA